MSDTRVATRPYIIGPSATSFVVPSGVGLQAGLSAFWDFTSVTAPADLTGNGNTLGVGGGAPTSGTGPNGGPAVTLNGTTDFFSIASNAFLSIGGMSFTLSCWRALNAVGNGSMMSKSAGVPFSGEYDVGHFAGFGGFLDTQVFDNGGGNTEQVGGTTVVGDDFNWHMTTLTYYSSINQANSYFDTVNDAACPLTLPFPPINTSSGDFRVGNDLGVFGFFSGSIALMGIWQNRALSPSELTTLFNGGTGLSFAQMA